MGLRSGLPNLGPPRRCVADLAAPIQLAPAAQQSKIKSAHHPPRSDRGQPVEAPQLAIHARVTRLQLDEFPLPGLLFEETVEHLYREDRFVQGTLQVGEHQTGIT